MPAYISQYDDMLDQLSQAFATLLLGGLPRGDAHRSPTGRFDADEARWFGRVVDAG
jgi:hypothetical protein